MRESQKFSDALIFSISQSHQTSLSDPLTDSLTYVTISVSCHHDPLVCYAALGSSHLGELATLPIRPSQKLYGFPHTSNVKSVKEIVDYIV